MLEQEKEFYEEARRRGAAVTLECLGSPVSFHGTMNGIRFYYRERSEVIRVALADGPGPVPTAGGAGVTTVVFDGALSPVDALKFALDAVETHRHQSN